MARPPSEKNPTAPALFGRDLFGDAVNPATAALRTRFIIPPFTVLDARNGEWQGRKRMWLKLGIKSEIGRGNVQGSLESVRRLQRAAPGGSPMPAMDYSNKERGDGKGRPRKRAAAAMTDGKLKKFLGFKSGVPEDVVERNKNRRAVPIQCAFDHSKKRDERDANNPEDPIETWVVSSIFDPVLCELAYRWWCPEGGQIIDPFAGGSVRGIVAGALGRKYWGCDLRVEQIAANEDQADEIKVDPRPVWVCGDSRDTLADAPEADFLFTCPPYGDLEIYSDEEGDISGYDFPQFVKAYKEIIAKGCAKLKDNRFACVVVGDFRDKETGIYRNFVSGTIRCFQDAGMKLYNELILVTVVGTASLRASRQFRAGFKCVKTHQNVLVFVKGDWKLAAEHLRNSGGPG